MNVSIFIPFVFLLFVSFFFCIPEKSFNGSIESISVERKTAKRKVGFQMGKLHNDLCQIAINNWSISSSDEQEIIAEIERIFKLETRELAKYYSYDLEEFAELVDIKKTESIDIYKIAQNHSLLAELGISESLTDKVSVFMETFSAFSEEIHFDDLKSQLIIHFKKYSGDLAIQDSQTYNDMIDVAIHSAYLWMPESQGGLGSLKRVQKLKSEKGDGILTGWQKVAVSDSIGALTGIGLAATALGPTAFLPTSTGGIPPSTITGGLTSAKFSIRKAITGL